MEQDPTTTSDCLAEQQSDKGLSVLLEEAHSALAIFDSATAQKLLAQTAEQFPDNEKALFEYGYFLYEQGNTQLAEHFLNKSLALAPDKNAKKYFALAQINSNPSQAEALYVRGIEIVLGKIEAAKSSESGNVDDRLKTLSRLAAQGFCGLAQLEVTKAAPYFENMNHLKFLDCAQKAIAFDPSYLEIYSQLSLYYFNIQDEMSCRQTLAELVSKVRELEEKGDDELQDYGPAFFIPIVRMMVEGEIWNDGAYLMEVGTQTDGKNLEANYLYAFCLFQSEEYEQAADVCLEIEKLGVLKSDDKELIQGFLELKQEVHAALSKVQAQAEDELVDSENDWIDEGN